MTIGPALRRRALHSDRPPSDAARPRRAAFFSYAALRANPLSRRTRAPHAARMAILDPLRQRAWCTLLRAPGIGPAHARTLVERAGGIDGALAGGRALWRACAMPAEAHDALERPDRARLEADLEWLARGRRALVAFDDPDYPPLLARSPDPPAALFVMGDPATLWQPQIAVIGARAATPAGLATARSFASAFARAGIAVTSGLADGIDGAAHRGALDGGGTTIAVCGTGLERVYPRKHEALAREIEASGGALVSELPLDTDARADQFPRRNRILAALALGTLVIEAGMRSGSLITARLAGDAGREVFALPGSIHNPLARGCHRLLRQGAILVETADDVLDELGPIAASLGVALRERLAATPCAAVADRGAVRAGATAPRDPQRESLVAALADDAPTLDMLVARCGLTASTVSSMLLLLELEGAVAALPGGRYQRQFRA